MEPILPEVTQYGGGERGKGRLGGGDGWQRGSEGEYPGTIIQRIILINLQVNIPENARIGVAVTIHSSRVRMKKL